MLPITTDETTHPPDPHTTDPGVSAGGLPFPVIAVGGSAGGLEAFTELLHNIPDQPGLSILFVMHLDRNHESLLPELLAKVSPLLVLQATDGLRVEIDHVYVIPPGVVMTLEQGKLVLNPRPIRGPNMPLDHLLRSLARSQRSQAVGIIMSGDGTDGTLGFQALKAEGGITFAQDGTSAKHESMPRAAIANGHVDHVLPPRQIAYELLRLNRHSYARLPRSAQPADNGDAGEAASVNKIIGLLRTHTDVDFTHYKRTTINRRIRRRMALHGLENFDAYHDRLRNDPIELSNLYQDFLIRVTQFFRDPEAFDALKEQVFPALLEGRSPNAPIRVWVAGCATGEEVYSLAIALHEFLANRPGAPGIKILATDLNEVALERARMGLYIDNIELDVSPERLRRYFLRCEGHYQIVKSIRDLCVFSRHNMVSDPPFSHLDLVSCRNVLIYLDAPLQKRVMPVLHYALNPDGYLFLGSSESTGSFGELFLPVDGKHRLYRKKQAPVGMPVEFGPYLIPNATNRLASDKTPPPLWSALEVQREADRIVIARYAPVGVVIDESLTVLQFRGRTASFLEPAPGMASLDLLRMLREGLLAEVRSAIDQAKAENRTVQHGNLLLQEGGQTRPVAVEVIPFKVPLSSVLFFMVLFHDPPRPAAAAAPGAPAPTPTGVADQLVGQLQQELGALREYLQSVIEEQESTNEELKSANEEILSANEELQSTNEELQTAKEESQSANEELSTTNEELRHRNIELSRLNNDLVNVLAGVNIPIVMVDRDLRLRRFTPLAEKLFNLIPTDMGRRLGDIKPNLVMDDLIGRIEAVIDTLTPYESEVRDNQGRWYALHIRPYVTTDNMIDGASIVLLDIDGLKRSGGRA